MTRYFSDNSIVEFRPLMKADIKSVTRIDQESGFCISQWIEDLNAEEQSDYAYGAFQGESCIGYCSLGRADDCCDYINQHPYKSVWSKLLSDVYISPKYRNQGIASTMVKQAIQVLGEGETIYLEAMHEQLIPFYEALGFISIPEAPYVMFFVYSAVAFRCSAKYADITHLQTLHRFIKNHRETVISIENGDVIENYLDSVIKEIQNNKDFLYASDLENDIEHALRYIGEKDEGIYGFIAEVIRCEANIPVELKTTKQGSVLMIFPSSQSTSELIARYVAELNVPTEKT